MNKFKKLFSLVFVLLLVLSLTGCGNKEENKDNDKKNETKEVSSDWADINESNYVGILKAKTGIDLSKLGNVSVTDAKGYMTKIADITGKYESGTTKVSIFEGLIKELLRVTNNSIWSIDVNNNTYRIEKKDEYKDYESYYNWKLLDNEDLADNLTGALYIENYTISYTFTNSQFNVRISSYVIR